MEVSVLEYSKLQQQDFMSVIKNEDNFLQKFIFKNGDVPRKKMSNVPLDLKSHYVIRMKPLNDDAKIFFILYDSSKPIIVPSKKQFYFALDKDGSQEFEIELSSDFKEIELDCKLTSGEIEFAISDLKNDFKTFDSMKGLSHKHKKFSIVANPQDIVVFNKVYLMVKAKALSQFFCRATPQGEFRMISPFEVELIEISPLMERYVYFNINEQDMHRTVTLDIYQGEGFKKPEFLYSGEQNVTTDKYDSFLPMPLQDFNEKLENSVLHLQVKPISMKGSFIIKFLGHNVTHHVKLALSYDNVHILETNGLHKTFISKTQNISQYSIYLPDAGEFRLIPDACSGMKINNAHFSNDAENISLKFEDNYA